MNTYNGWTNRETWLVNIWFMDSFDGERVSAESLRDRVDEYVEEIVPSASFVTDMLDLGLIDWTELADTHNSDLKIQEAAE
ncbi:MAG: hypothetical protein V7700_16420 [Halioglobus sp.]